MGQHPARFVRVYNATTSRLTIRSRWTNRTLEARVHSHDGPTRALITCVAHQRVPLREPRQHALRDRPPAHPAATTTFGHSSPQPLSVNRSAPGLPVGRSVARSKSGVSLSLTFAPASPARPLSRSVRVARLVERLNKGLTATPSKPSANIWGETLPADAGPRVDPGPRGVEVDNTRLALPVLQSKASPTNPGRPVRSRHVARSPRPPSRIPTRGARASPARSDPDTWRARLARPVGSRHVARAPCPPSQIPTRGALGTVRCLYNVVDSLMSEASFFRLFDSAARGFLPSFLTPVAPQTEDP
eukprot:355873-Prorocentrum_minimum.AAC.1